MVSNPSPARSPPTPRMSGCTPNSSCTTMTPDGAGSAGGWARYAGMLVPSSTAISMVVMVPSSAPAKLVTTAAFYWYWHEHPGIMAAAGDPAALGQLLRARRALHAPAAGRLPAATRRRPRGLRREEVAMLASVSATYSTFLEQGRP